MTPLDWTGICKRYRGKWVAMKPDHKTVAGSGDTLSEAKAAAEKKGCSETFLTRIPTVIKNFAG